MALPLRFSPSVLTSSACATCRLRACLATWRNSRARGGFGRQYRAFSNARVLRKETTTENQGQTVWEFEDQGESLHAATQEEYITTAELNQDAQLLDDLRKGQMGYALEAQDDAAAAHDDFASMRTHPLTLANRFATSPATLPLPAAALLDSTASLLADVKTKHLTEAAHRIFGGVGLPYSTATPTLAKTMQQLPVALDAAQAKMTEMEADVFVATLLPPMYASAMGVLVETRKRLGTAWAEEMVRKAAKGELRILDAGGAGAGVLAVRELLRAEWERMHEESGEGPEAAGVEVEIAGGKAGGAGVSPPLGIATVLTGSDTLRRRASRILENTTFVPRLPDYLHTEEAKKKGKFDVVIASHALWHLREDYMRKSYVENLWSMLSTEGGVLVILEKGVARGFEVVAGAREMLLSSRIASPDSMHKPERVDDPDFDDPESTMKEPGAIIAPCTNHASCPMYKPQGVVKGRRDICHFAQRYVRSPIQQRILHARDKNFEDVKFSYLAVQRGRDIRAEQNIVQDAAATDAAFAGYESTSLPEDTGTSDNLPVPSLILPRSILPPLKRRGHVIIDLCTPAGALERWTVPRSFSKQALRDARKSSWGDLWALGAKTRIPRFPSVKNRKEPGARNHHEGTEEGEEGGRGEVVTISIGRRGGKMRGPVKIGGVRDKRDKKADGRGRRKGRVLVVERERE